MYVSCEILFNKNNILWKLSNKIKNFQKQQRIIHSNHRYSVFFISFLLLILCTHTFSRFAGLWNRVKEEIYFYWLGMKKIMLRRANTHILVLISLFFFFSRHREHSKCITTKKEKEIASLLALFGWFIFVCCSPFFFSFSFQFTFFLIFCECFIWFKTKNERKSEQIWYGI